MRNVTDEQISQATSQLIKLAIQFKTPLSTASILCICHCVRALNSHSNSPHGTKDILIKETFTDNTLGKTWGKTKHTISLDSC